MTSYSAKLSTAKVYHEQETISSCVKLLLRDKEGSHFVVACSKAVLNCLLQREHFKEHVRLRLQARNLEMIYTRLRLNRSFRIQEIDNWLDSQADLFGSILAITVALADLNVNLTPVDDHVYTSLIEKPTAYVCLIENGWVVLRKTREQWYLLDPRISARTISDTYLLLIVQQLIHDNGLVFQISGGEFSRRADSGPGISVGHPSNARKERRQGQEDEASGDQGSNLGSVSLTDPQTSHPTDSRTTIPEPKPPDIPLNTHFPAQPENRRQTRRDETAKMIAHLYKLEIGAIIRRPRNPSARRPATKGSERKEEKGPDTAWQGNQHHQNQVKESTCCICLLDKPDHALYPCGHQCLCASCKVDFLRLFTSCPICKSPVSDSIRIYKT